MADTEFAELRKQCISSLYLCMDNVSKYLDEEKNHQFDKLKSYVELYCELEAKQKVAIEALERAKRETDSSNINGLQEKFNNYLSNLAGVRNNVHKHPYMIEFCKRMAERRQQERQNLDDSDLAITESQLQYIDPITKRPIENPVKNNVCGHIYEKESIMKLISIKSRTRCPVAGCGNQGPILMDHLIMDEELRFRMTLTQHSTMMQEQSILDLDVTT